ncbi:MAG TPA: hypothetical protein EYQ63_10350 [Fuerstia sp.]|nr:hypothetical protein [Fuerstiella sp.]
MTGLNPDGMATCISGYTPTGGNRRAGGYVLSRHRRWLCAALTTLVLLASVTTSAHAQDESVEPRLGRQSFIPADQLDAIFERSPRGVMLPRAEFQDLLQRAQQAQLNLAAIPTPMMMRSVTYHVAQLAEHAVVELVIDVEQFADNWQTLEIPVGNLLVEAATIEGSPGALGRDRKRADSVTLVHRKPGRFSLKMTLSTPLGSVGSDRVAAFQVIPNTAAELNVICPAERHLEINDLQLLRPDSLDQPATYRFPLNSQNAARLKWTSQQQKADTQSLVFARTDAHVQLSSDTLRWTSETRLSVFGSSINQLVAAVPANLEITAVDSMGLESWKLEDDPERKNFTRLLLSYRQPFSEDRIVKVLAVTPNQSAGSSRIPSVEFVDITSHTGRLFVAHEHQLRLMSTVGGGIRQLSSAEATGARSQDEVFDFWLQDFQLSVSVRPRDRELFGEINSVLSVIDTTASFQSEITIETLNAPLFDATLTLPDGWQIGDLATDDGKPLKWRAGTIANQIVVEPATPVEPGALFSFVVPFVRTISDPEVTQTITLPLVTVADTLVVGGTYQISGASDLSIAPLDMVGLSPVGDEDGTLLFRTQGTTYSGKLAVIRKPVRISSRSVLRSWMDTRQSTVEATVTVDVTNGTTRTLQLTLPEALGEEVRFTVVSIEQVPGFNDQQVPTAVTITEQTAADAENSERTFSLTFDKRIAGALTVKTRIQRPRDGGRELTVPFIKVAEAVRQHGLIVFEALPEQQLVPVDGSDAISGLTVADAGLVEPPPEDSGRRVALVYRYIQPEYSLNLAETLFDTQTVPSAVCEQMANVSLLSEAGTIQRSCTASFRCVGVQTLRFTLPMSEHSFLWSTILNGEAVEVRRDANAYLVAIPTNSRQTEHTLEILFESAAVDALVFGTTTQQSLQLSIDTDGGAASPIDVLEQTWDVRYPDNMMMLAYDGGFHPLQQLEQPGWLQNLAAQFRLPTLRSTTNRLVTVSILLLVLFVGTVLICRRRWKSLACVCLLGLLLVPMTLLTFVMQERAASEYFSEAPKVAASVAYDVAATAETAIEEKDEQWEDERYNRSPLEDIAVPNSAWASPGGFALSKDPLSSQNMTQSEAIQESRRRLSESDAEVGEFGGGGMAGEAVQAVPQDTNLSIQNNVRNFDGEASGPAVIAGLDAISVPLAKRSGSARLSIRAAIAQPADYRSLHFRSIGTGQDSGTLQVVVQGRNHLHAMRLIAASIVILICLACLRMSLITKMGISLLLFLLAAAVVPLLPNQWQTAVDGVAIGTATGIGIWVILGMASCCRSCVAWCCQHGCCGFFKRRGTTVSAGILLLIVTAASTEAAPQAVAAPPLESVLPSEGKTVSRPEVVLPYTPGRPELLADRVFLPRDEFLKLYRSAYPDELGNPQTPSTTGVSAAFYKSINLRQVKDSVWSQTFSVRYIIRSFSDKPVNVPLPIGTVAVRSASLNGSAAILLGNAVTHPVTGSVNQSAQQTQILQQQQAEPQIVPPPVDTAVYSIHIPSKGLHLVDVVFEVAATVENSIGRLSLPLRPVPAATVLFDLPEDRLEARVNGRSNTFRKDGRQITIPASAAADTRIEWRPASTQSVTDTIFHATVNTALSIDDSGLTLQSSITINCRQGQLSEVDIAVPGDYSVQQVAGADVAGWSLESAAPPIADIDEQPAEADQRLPSVSSRRLAGRPALRLLFKQPVENQTEIRLTLFRRQITSAEKTDLPIPVPAVKGASRDSGNVTVLAGRELEVRVDSLSGVSQVNAAESQLPAGVDSNVRRVLAWRYTRHPVAITTKVHRTADRLRVTAIHAVQLESQRQLWTSLITANVSGAPRRRLEIEVPTSFLALDVSANGLDDWYFTESPGNEGSKILNIQLATAATGTINAVIQGQADRSNGQSDANLVAPRLAGADELRTTLSVWLDAASEIAETSADGWKRFGSGTTIDSRILKLQADAPDISFTSAATTPGTVALSLRQAPASLIAESVSVTNVTDTSVELTLGLNWKIARAATRELSFTLPQGLSDVFDFQIPGLRQLERHPVDNDRVEFTIHLQQPASDRFFVLGTGTLPLPDSRQILADPPQFLVKQDTTASIASQSHFWVIVSQSAGLLEAVDVDTDGDDVSADQIKTNIPTGFLQQSVAIRRLRSDRPNSPWQLKFPERQQVSPAVIALAAHTTVIAEDGTWRSQHVLQVRNESRQFLPVRLPQDSRFLFCLVKGKPTRVVSRAEGDGKLFLIPVPQSGELSTPFEVRIALAGALSPIGKDLNGINVGIPIPEFPEYRDFPDYGITVMRNTWSVHLPDSWYAATLDDPRQTNVVIADEADFQDASLLSAVDNIKSIMNSMKSSKGQGKFGRAYRALEDQQSILFSQRGNTRAAQQQREQTLEELQILLGDQQIGADFDFNVQVPGSGSTGGEVNLYLSDEALGLNTFNNDNNADFIAGNGIQFRQGSFELSGGQNVSDARHGSPGTFNFSLPAQIQAEDKKSSKLDIPESLVPQLKSESAKPSSELQRSQLLGRRESNVKEQASKARARIEKGAQTWSFKERLIEDIVAPGQQSRRPPGQQGISPQQPQSGGRQSGSLNEPQSSPSAVPAFGLQQLQTPAAQPPVADEPSAASLLSLKFQIPEAGIRHDFVRTGGNAALTLTVRNREAIGTGLGFAWAIACVVAAITLISSCKYGVPAMMSRLFVLAALAGLCGWLCLSGELQLQSLVICVIAAVCFSIGRILASFRNVKTS